MAAQDTASVFMATMEQLITAEATPMDRSIASMPSMPKRNSFMSRSFTMEHSHPDIELSLLPASRSSVVSTTSDDEATPQLTNWAYISLIKNQRNYFREGLKLEKLTSGEQRASVAALRRLAFRLAVNISVKETRIANSARQLALSRKKEYLSGKSAEARIEQLTQSLEYHEKRNREILESLEQTAMLTLQYSTASPASSRHSLPAAVRPLSPPPSPPTRISSLALQRPRTPRSPAYTPSSSKTWDNPNITSRPTPPKRPSTEVIDIRTSNERLIKAKRDSDHALLVCRNRIEALQADCLRSKESARALEVHRAGLEEDIRDYKSRVSALQASRAAVEQTLRATQLKLENSTRSEAELRVELELKGREIEQLEKISRLSQEDVDVLKQSKIMLEEEVQNHNSQIEWLEISMMALDGKVKDLLEKQDSAKKYEAELQAKLTANESQRGAMIQQLENSMTNVVALEKSVMSFEEQIQEYNAQMKSLEESAFGLDGELRSTQELKVQAEQELVAVRLSVSELESSLRSATETNANLQEDIEDVRRSRAELELDLESTQEKATVEAEAKESLQHELNSLQVLMSGLEDELRTAHERIHILEQPDPEIERELEDLKTSKASLEQQLEALQQSSSSLQDDLQTTLENLSLMEASTTELQSKLQDSESSKLELQSKLQSSEASIADLLSMLRDSETSTVDLQTKLQEYEVFTVELLAKLQNSDTSAAELQFKLQEYEASTVELQSKLQGSETSTLELQSKLQDSESSTVDLIFKLQKSEASTVELQSRLQECEASTLELQSKLQESEASTLELRSKLQASETSKAELQNEVQSAQQAKSKVEEQLRNALESKASLESGLHSTNSRLNVAETAELDLQAKLSVADVEIQELRRTNANLEDSERHMTARLNVAENELEVLKRANEELEAFLNQAEQEMAAAEASTSECERRLDLFLDESNAKMSAAQQSKIKYKRRLITSGKELATLKTENSSLQSQIEQKDHDIKNLKSIESQLQAELSSKNTTIEELQTRKIDFSASMSEIEEELRMLRETKKTFETVVQTLQEKATSLNVPAEVEQPAEIVETAGSSEKEDFDGFIPSPMVQRILRSRADTLTGEPRSSRSRPMSQCTSLTNGDDWNSWALEIERVRMLRDETAMQLKGVEKVKSALKKTLKASETELERLEKKSRPNSKAFSDKGKSPFSPSPDRPSTSDGCRTLNSVAALDPDTRTWTSPKSNPGSDNGTKTPQRPSTANRLGMMGSFKRSPSTVKLESNTLTHERRSWSTMLKHAFTPSRKLQVER